MAADKTEPQTAAGQRLDLDWPGAFIDRLAWRQRILAIEREAHSGLDAGLLKTAIANHQMRTRAVSLNEPCVPQCARDIAAEYAALSSGEAAPVDGLRRELTARLAMVNHITGEDSDCTGDDGRPWCDACWASAVEFLDPGATFALAIEARTALREEADDGRS